MKRLGWTVLAVVLLLLIPIVAQATIYEVVHDQVFVRAVTAPVTETAYVTTDDPGELRITNEDSVDLGVSTDVVVDGVDILHPFYLDMGYSYVMPLVPGSHVVDVTLRGSPGGTLRLIVLEEVIEKVGYEILPDGTVLQKKTDLIWHRNPHSPGTDDPLPWPGTGSYGKQFLGPEAADRNGTPWMSFDYYIADFNAGVYGSDAFRGNAGHDDWRMPTIDELLTMADRRFTGPAISRMDGGGVIGDPFCDMSIPFTEWPVPNNGYGGGMQFGEPFYACCVPGTAQHNSCPEWWEDLYYYTEFPQVISQTPTNDWGYGTECWVRPYWRMDVYSGSLDFWYTGGFVWPVRGPE